MTGNEKKSGPISNFFKKIKENSTINCLNENKDEKPYSNMGLNVRKVKPLVRKEEKYSKNSDGLDDLSLLIKDEKNESLLPGESKPLVKPKYSTQKTNNHKNETFSKSYNNSIKQYLKNTQLYISSFNFEEKLGKIKYNKFKLNIENLLFELNYENFSIKNNLILTEKIIKGNLDPLLNQVLGNGYRSEFFEGLNAIEISKNNFSEEIIELEEMVNLKNQPKFSESKSEKSFSKDEEYEPFNGNSVKSIEEPINLELFAKTKKSSEVNKYQRDEDRINNSVENVKDQSIKMTQEMIDEYHKIPTIKAQRDEYESQVGARDKIIEKLMKDKNELIAVNKANNEIAESARKICNIKYNNIQDVHSYLGEIPNQLSILKKERDSWEIQYKNEKTLSTNKEEKILELDIENKDLENTIELLEGTNSNLNESNYELQKELDNNSTYNDKVKRILFDTHKEFINISNTYLSKLQPEENSKFMVEYQKQNDGNDNLLIELEQSLSDPNVYAKKIEEGKINPVDFIKQLGNATENILTYANDQSKRNNHQEEVLSDLLDKVKTLHANFDHVGEVNYQIPQNQSEDIPKRIVTVNA
jgi:hypothetical protein